MQGRIVQDGLVSLCIVVGNCVILSETAARPQEHSTRAAATEPVETTAWDKPPRLESASSELRAEQPLSGLLDQSPSALPPVTAPFESPDKNVCPRLEAAASGPLKTRRPADATEVTIGELTARLAKPPEPLELPLPAFDGLETIALEPPDLPSSPLRGSAEPGLRLGSLLQRSREPQDPDFDGTETARVQTLSGVSRISSDHHLRDLLTASSSHAAFALDRALADRLVELAALADEDPEMALGLAVSLFEQWNDPPQSERILNNLLALAATIAGQEELEAQVTVIRWFLQRLQQPTLRHRVQLRLGRLYYTSGDFGKAVVELPVDKSQQEPNRYQSLAGLYKAVSLIRLKQPSLALPLLQWVATRSTVLEQRVRAALLLGRLHALYQQPAKARHWLLYVAERGSKVQQRAQARQLLAELEAKQPD